MTQERKERRANLDLTEEQVKYLWDRFPNDPVLISFMCREAYYTMSVPLKTGRWTKYDVEIYVDSGSMGSGLTLVKWDQSNIPGCLPNGFVPGGIPIEEIVWDDNPERERIIEIRRTLSDWF